MSDASFYTWRAKYGGMDVSEAKRLRTPEDENRSALGRQTPAEFARAFTISGESRTAVSLS
jgi:hypothetical protein